MISLGDLLVFVAVLVIVAVFLKILHSFIGGAPRELPAEVHRQPHPETPAKVSPPKESGKITASQSVSR